jgi:Flp pilus assembly protein TadG
MQRSQRGKPRLLQRTEGATAVEFAIVLPVLLLLICSIMDFGNLYYQKHTVNEAARVGARLAAVGGTSSAVTTAVQRFGSQLQTAPYMSPTNPASNTDVTVTVTSSVHIITPIISHFFPSNPYNVTGTSVMRVE